MHFWCVTVALRLDNCNLKRPSLYDMLSNCSLKLIKVLDHLMYNLKKSEEIVCHVSFEIMGMFIRCSCL